MRQTCQIRYLRGLLVHRWYTRNGWSKGAWLTAWRSFLLPLAEKVGRRWATTRYRGRGRANPPEWAAPRPRSKLIFYFHKIPGFRKKCLNSSPFTKIE